MSDSFSSICWFNFWWFNQELLSRNNIQPTNTSVISTYLFSKILTQMLRFFLATLKNTNYASLLLIILFSTSMPTVLNLLVGRMTSA